MSRTKRSASAFLFVLPTLLALGIVAVYPIIGAIWLSLHRLVLVFHEQHFIGLRNYAFLLHDRRFWSALGNTSYFTALSVSAELTLGLAFALLLDRSFRGRGLARGAVLVPWAIPTVVSAKMWAWLFNADYGMVTRLLPGKEINWLGTPGYALHAAIFCDVWKCTPFAALLLLGGLQMIPRELYQAAAIDGASRLRAFRSITLPMLAPTLVVVLIFRTLDAFRVFDLLFVLTEGGPANTTESLSMYGYKTLMRIGDFGYGSTLAVATFLLIVLISVTYLLSFRRLLRGRM